MHERFCEKQKVPKINQLELEMLSSLVKYRILSNKWILHIYYIYGVCTMNDWEYFIEFPSIFSAEVPAN